MSPTHADQHPARDGPCSSRLLSDDCRGGWPGNRLSVLKRLIYVGPVRCSRWQFGQKQKRDVLLGSLRSRGWIFPAEFCGLPIYPIQAIQAVLLWLFRTVPRTGLEKLEPSAHLGLPPPSSQPEHLIQSFHFGTHTGGRREPMMGASTLGRVINGTVATFAGTRPRVSTARWRAWPQQRVRANPRHTRDPDWSS